MKQIDARLSCKERQLLTEMVGSEFIKFRCDPFVFSNSVFERVGIFTSCGTLLLKNEMRSVDYFGVAEDVSRFEIAESEESGIESALEGVVQTDTPIGRFIREVRIVQECHSLCEDGRLAYEVYITRGLIFVMDDGYEIAFERIDTMAEYIAVSRGQNLINGFASVERYKGDWEEDCEMKVSRFIDIIK